jgi:hypothetical protein
MNSPTKTANERSGALLQLAVIPLLACQLGRQSMTFSGSATAWFILACNVVALGISLYCAADAIRKS